MTFEALLATKTAETQILGSAHDPFIGSLTQRVRRTT